MKAEDRTDYIIRYEKRLQEYGYSPATLGWGVQGRQEVRFSVLANLVLRSPDSSVLDVGCGFGDLYGFLNRQGWHGAYTGIDIVPGLLRVARQQYPGIDVREADVTDEAERSQSFDFVVASGVFNAALPSGDNEIHIEAALDSMYRCSRTATCVDFLSTYVDFRKPGAHHTDPGWALALAKKFTRRVLIRLDYMPYEFSLFLFRDETISSRNVFQAFEDQMRQMYDGRSEEV